MGHVCPAGHERVNTDCKRINLGHYLVICKVIYCIVGRIGEIEDDEFDAGPKIRNPCNGLVT